MKDWKFVQTGNYDAQKELGIKPAPVNLNQLKSEDEKKIKDLFQKNGGDYEKTIKDIKLEYKSLQEDLIRTILYKLVGVPQKAKNESIDKQEWSMFKGLAKDAEKEVGNSWTQKEEDRLNELSRKKPSQMNDSEWKEFQELQKKFYIEQDKALKKLGNAYKRDEGNGELRNEYNAEIYRLEKKMEELYRRGQGHSAMQVQKQIEQLQRELRELGNKKTGNELPNDAEVKYNGYIIRYYPYQGKYIVTHPTDFSKTNAFIGKKFSTSEEAIKAIQKRGVGNEETKADKKFGTVMGEFKEGTLKSSSGETVTDPAQAKAIAYSEADKVDNLKRARNSIKK